MVEKIYITSVGLFGAIFFGGIGFFSGYMMSINKQSLPILSENIQSSTVPVLSLEDIENGILAISTNTNNIRISIPNGEIITPHSKDTIHVDIQSILPMLKTLPAPDGMKFVASKRGKTYWSLDAPQAFLISAKNRVFYPNAQQAQEDGKKKGQ